MRKWYTYVCIFIFCVVASSDNTPANRGKRWALLIGIDTYDSKTVSSLRYSAADVSAFKAALTDPTVGGFDPDRVFLMTAGDTREYRPTYTNVLLRLKQLSELIRPEDTFVFYFSGHGITREGNSFLLSVNADAGSLSPLMKSAIPLADVRRILSSIKAHQVLFILDTCRNDPATGKGKQDNLLTEAFARDMMFRREPAGMTEFSPITATLYACSVGERAYEWEEKGHSVFNYYLLEGLKGKAADLDGGVTINSLAAYTQKHVNRWTQLNGRKQQTPWLVRDGAGKLVLAPASVESTVPKGMVLIPAGDFQMGSNDSEAEAHEKPVHTVYIDAFYIDVYEVTNAQYKAFIDANPQWGKDQIPDDYTFGNYLSDWDGNNYPSGRGKQPVIRVSWYAAMAYSQWAGKRLPTEAEWEKAARGGLVGQKYPWGDALDADKANYGKAWYGRRVPTTAVGSYSPNGYGLYDMAGNASEWCLDAYNADFYKDSPPRNPIAGVESIAEIMANFMNLENPHVLRGGSWASAPNELRVAFRSGYYPLPTYDHIGFRCAKAANP